MKSNIQDIILPENLQEIDKKLSNIEKLLKDIVKSSIEEIKNDPTKEKEVISLWVNHSNIISNFFFEECERTNNKELYKNIIKYVMFNR